MKKKKEREKNKKQKQVSLVPQPQAACSAACCDIAVRISKASKLFLGKVNLGVSVLPFSKTKFRMWTESRKCVQGVRKKKRDKVIFFFWGGVRFASFMHSILPNENRLS